MKCLLTVPTSKFFVFSRRRKFAGTGSRITEAAQAKKRGHSSFPLRKPRRLPCQMAPSGRQVTLFLFSCLYHVWTLAAPIIHKHKRISTCSSGNLETLICRISRVCRVRRVCRISRVCRVRRKNGGGQAHATQTIFAVCGSSPEGRQDPSWRSLPMQLANRRTVRPNRLHHIGLGDGLTVPGLGASRFRQVEDRQRSPTRFGGVLRARASSRTP
jgi:hypothetical protein